MPRVLLSCKHIMLYEPEPRRGDIVYCTLCQGYAKFAGVAEWKVKCCSCSYARRYGEDKPSARAFATRHAYAYAHDLKLLYGAEVVEEIHHDSIPLDSVTKL